MSNAGIKTVPSPAHVMVAKNWSANFPPLLLSNKNNSFLPMIAEVANINSDITTERLAAILKLPVLRFCIVLKNNGRG